MKLSLEAMDTLHRRKVRKQDPDAVEEVQETALQAAMSSAAADGAQNVMGDMTSGPKAFMPTSGEARDEKSSDVTGKSQSADFPDFLVDHTPEQTPSSRAPQSPYRPHPFWSEKAKAEAELAQARPSTLDDEARRLQTANVARPLSLEGPIRPRGEVRVDEEVIKEPAYTLMGSSTLQVLEKALWSRGDGPACGSALNDLSGIIVPMGTTSGAAEGAVQPAAEALVPYEAGQLSGVQPQPVKPSKLQPVQIGISKPKSSEAGPMAFPSEDHLLEITKLRSLVEHLSD